MAGVTGQTVAMAQARQQRPHPFRFFTWVLALSIPFYIWGVFWPVHGLSLGFPATVVMVVIPAAVATMQTRREQGSAWAWELWRRVGDVRRIRSVWWLAISVFCMPVASLAAYAVMRMVDLPLPAHISVPFFQLPFIFGVFFFGAIFEEIGWSGYVTEPLQRRHGVLRAGLIIGFVWALWHIVPWWLGQGHPFSWVMGQTLATIAMRIIMGWVYAYGGRSLFLAIVFHAMINTSFGLFPNKGSHYDPLVTAAILSIITAVIAFTRPNGKVG